MTLETDHPMSQLVAPRPLHIITYSLPKDAARLSDRKCHNDLISLTPSESLQNTLFMRQTKEDNCVYMIRDADFVSRLERLRFDIVIVDGFLLSYCMFLVPVRLRVPFVDFYSHPKLWDARVPVFPSVVPFTWTFFGERMTFRERLKNLLAYVASEFADYQPLGANTSLLRQYAPQFRSWAELKRQAVLFVSTTDYILGVHQPSLPNTIHVTSLSAKAAQPLPAHFERIVSTAADHGVIVMSLGSVQFNVPTAILSRFFDAFSQLPQTVLFRFTNEVNFTLPQEVPKNVHLLPWLPQNDVIGHARTVLFITHCGNGGLNEAVYHGVPMVAFPIFAEQAQNAVRMVRRGFGVSLDIKHFTAAELVSAITEVLQNATYRSTVAHASAILKDRPMNSLQTVTFWVEHVMKFGGAHLRSHGQDMAAYEFFMIDIAAFLLTIMIVVIFVLYKTALFVYTRIGTSKRAKQKTR